MKLIINKPQLQLLADNFIIVEGKGLCQTPNNLIKESRLREYLVAIWIYGFYAQIRIGAQNSGTALMIVKKLLPKGRITGSVISI